MIRAGEGQPSKVESVVVMVATRWRLEWIVGVSGLLSLVV